MDATRAGVGVSDDQLAQKAMGVVTMVLRDQMPALLGPERVAALAVAGLEQYGMLRWPSVPPEGICGPCGHTGAEHGDAGCRGQGPPAYGACKCGRFRLRPESVPA